jgi:hypothetical protein
VYAALEKAFDVKFMFADEKITNMHILQKIRSYIRGSEYLPGILMLLWSLGLRSRQRKIGTSALILTKQTPKKFRATFEGSIVFSIRASLILKINCQFCLISGIHAALTAALTTTSNHPNNRSLISSAGNPV